jgi:hypothetical protein
MVEFQVDRTIAASPERVFDWLADPANLTAAPVILKVRWVKVGALREAIGLGGWFREQITAHDRPRAYSYRVVRSIPPFDHEGGHTDVHPVGRRHARRLADQLHAPGSRRRQADGGGQPSAAALELPSCPRRLREGTGKLARGTGSIGASEGQRQTRTRGARAQWGWRATHRQGLIYPPPASLTRTYSLFCAAAVRVSVPAAVT